MGIENSTDNDEPSPDTVADRQLRGDELKGPEQRSAVEHMAYEKARNPDTVLRLDGEKDTLYNDGLDIDEETDTLAGTRGPSSGIKP